MRHNGGSDELGGFEGDGDRDVGTALAQQQEPIWLISAQISAEKLGKIKGNVLWSRRYMLISFSHVVDSF